MATKRVLVIVAHADDMEFTSGGTIAKMASLGYEVREVIATNNERGTLNPGWTGEDAAEARREEARRRRGGRRRGGGRRCWAWTRTSSFWGTRTDG
jgi:LmbE family N-acetylglucosaminyl deacetylase